MTTYYIDTSSTGSGDGTTTATTGANAAWAAFSEITGLSAGDSVLLNKGDTWTETLTIPTSGSSGSPITFNSYGTGNAPIITGSDIRQECIIGVDKDFITIQNLSLTDPTHFGISVTTGNNWIIENNTIDGVGANSGASIKMNGVSFVSGQGNHIIRNNTITDSAIDGIYLQQSDNDLVAGNNISGITGLGSDGIQSEASQNYTISNNIVSLENTDSTKGCIIVGDGGANGLISGNICSFGNWGINCNDDDSVVSKNLCGPHTEDTFAGGLYMNPVNTNNITWKNNISFGSLNGFVAFAGATEHTNLKFLNNTIYNAGTRGVRLEKVDIEFKNNIIFCNSATNEVLKVTSLAGGGSFDSDNNCIFPNKTAGIHYVGTDYATLAAYQSGESKDLSSIAQDPQFVDAANNDFHIESSSPCKNAGIDVGVESDFDGKQRHLPPDIGTFEIIGKLTPLNYIKSKNNDL